MLLRDQDIPVGSTRSATQFVHADGGAVGGETGRSPSREAQGRAFDFRVAGKKKPQNMEQIGRSILSSEFHKAPQIIDNHPGHGALAPIEIAHVASPSYSPRA
jgi:hypothetical protein